MPLDTDIPTIQATSVGSDYHALNAAINLYNAEGKLQLEKDREATRSYFLNHVNPSTTFFYSLREKLDFLFENEYYEREVFDQYDFETQIKPLYKRVYAAKHRFTSFLGALKFYSQYALKTFDGQRYLERFEDRVAANALYLGNGDYQLALDAADEMIHGRYQPATPTFQNAGKKQRGEPVSCFLIRTEDNLESIMRSIQSAAAL
jgi:ribonucleoside-diphosphate reductase alpha chain